MAKPNTLFKEAYNHALALLASGRPLQSEPEIGLQLGVSRTTVRAVLKAFAENGLIRWDGPEKTLVRLPVPADYFPEEETSPLAQVIERRVMQRVLGGSAKPGDQINEAELARSLSVGTSAVREFLIRFSRFGLIEKQRNGRWVLKGFTRAFALDLIEIREMFELRSATSFIALPAGHPAWLSLEAIEAQHRGLLGEPQIDALAFSMLDDRFHRLIHEASRNHFIVDFYDVISMVFHYHYQWNKHEEAARNRAALAEHLDYIASLKTGDRVEVEYHCRRHLKSARMTLLQSIEGAPLDAL